MGCTNSTGVKNKDGTTENARKDSGNDNMSFETKEFPKFPADCKSLLCKYLTKEMWDKYQGKKDAHGFTLGMAINSGAVNFNSGIGVYAGSADTYITFAEFFDKIIEDYHQFKATDMHKSDMDWTKLKDLPNLDPENKFINSTRIRVARNMDGYPLGTLISKDQRNEVEKAVAEACTKFEGELKGTYYKLGALTKEQSQQLIDDHFLFKEGDKYLQACGLNRDWPEGRGIFHNDAKTFLIWINEEDQLRIISMENGGDIPGVFRRLATAADQIEKIQKFAHNDHLGYITTCPTNCGTGLRASVHIKLPLLAADMPRFEKIANEFHVQIRGIDGEHSESKGGVYDISNKRRLGRSEVDLTLDMYNGVKAMIDAEKSLQK